MKASERAALTLQANDISFRNGAVISDDELVDSGVVGSKAYKEAKNIQSGHPGSVVDFGEGLVTYNDTPYSFPYNQDHFWREGEILGPPEILRNSMRAQEAALRLKDWKEDRQDEISSLETTLRDMFGHELPEEVRSELEELHEEYMAVGEDYRERKLDLVNEKIQNRIER